MIQCKALITRLTEIWTSLRKQKRYLETELRFARRGITLKRGEGLKVSWAMMTARQGER